MFALRRFWHIITNAKNWKYGGQWKHGGYYCTDQFMSYDLAKSIATDYVMSGRFSSAVLYYYPDKGKPEKPHIPELVTREIS